MSAIEVLRLAQESGIRLGVAGADLILDAALEPASAVLEAIRRNKAEIIALLGADRDEWTAEDWQVFYHERAGIAEFDGGRSREQGEALAFESCVVEWMNRHPCRTDPGRCAACGEPDREGHAVVPFGTESHGHAWLHPGCWKGWYKARKAEAITALAAMGIENPVKFPNDFGKKRSE
jgi:hypothetical protein